MLHFTYAADIGIADLTVCFNETFSEYAIPIRLTTAAMQLKMQRAMIDAGLSAAAMEDHIPFGVIPEVPGRILLHKSL